jgi:DNA helicase-2/ATP-dependent DNA helicase PcrA
LLADHSLRAGVDPSLPLLTEVDAAELLEAAQESFLTEGFRAAYGDFDPLTVPDYAWHMGGPFDHALSVLDQLRNQAIAADEFRRRVVLRANAPGRHRVMAPLVGWLYAEYAAVLARRGQLDFDRLIMEAANLLERDDVLRVHLRARFRALLVDEYQDTNFAQERLLRALAAEGGGSVTVVGDPRQAIYVWREARVENIARFPGAGMPRFEAPLTENRRSLSPILAAANRAIGGYAFSAPPEFDAADVLQPDSEHAHFTGDVVHLHALPDRDSEAQAIVDWVRRARAEGFAYREVALLIRARTYLPIYLAALQAAGLPVEVSAGDAFYTRPEILDAIHLLNFCLDPADDLSLVRVLTGPAAGLTQDEVAALRPDDGRHLWPAVLAAGQPIPPIPEIENGVTDNPAPRLARLVAFWQAAQAQRWRLPPDAFVAWALRSGGLLKPVVESPAGGVGSPFSAQGKGAGGIRSAALHKLLAVAHLYAAQNPAHGLPDLVAHLRRLLASDERLKSPELNSQADAVQVLTAHAAKGLEFPFVIAGDSRQKVIPNRDFSPFHEPEAGLVLPRSKENEDDPAFLERMRRARNEARCLWYVTLTRAKRRLVITAPSDSSLDAGSFATVKTLFEELWNSLAQAPAPGVVLVPPADEPLPSA